MSESDKKSQENLDEALIDILKNIQSKLLHKEVSHFNDFIGEMNQKVENIEHIGTLKTDNPKFNEFITKFSQDSKNAQSEDMQKIANKLMIAYLYINTETEEVALDEE
jgi:hypothetical protein